MQERGAEIEHSTLIADRIDLVPVAPHRITSRSKWLPLSATVGRRPLRPSRVTSTETAREDICTRAPRYRSSSVRAGL